MPPRLSLKPFTTAAFTLAAFILIACAAPETPSKHQNQPHLPPPDFSVNEVSEPRYCGVRGAPTAICETGEFCRRTTGDLCGAADAPGICSPVPENCGAFLEPICGCDGKTYDNECAANSKGVSAAYAGECKP